MIITEFQHLAWVLVHNGLEPDAGHGGCSCDLCSLMREKMNAIRKLEAHDRNATEPECEYDEPEFIIEFPMDGRWARSADYPESYTPAQASKILNDDLSGLKVGYRVVYK